jgi:hypothetical protein
MTIVEFLDAHYSSLWVLILLCVVISRFKYIEINRSKEFGAESVQAKNYLV